MNDVQVAQTPLVLKAQRSFYVGGEKVEQTQGELGNLAPGEHITVMGHSQSGAFPLAAALLSPTVTKALIGRLKAAGGQVDGLDLAQAHHDVAQRHGRPHTYKAASERDDGSLRTHDFTISSR